MADEKILQRFYVSVTEVTFTPFWGYGMISVHEKKYKRFSTLKGELTPVSAQVRRIL